MKPAQTNLVQSEFPFPGIPAPQEEQPPGKEMPSEPPQRKRGLTFLTDELVHKPNEVPTAFRDHHSVARYRNGEILTEGMFWATLTFDASGHYWLILEAGRQHLPSQPRATPRSAWFLSPKHWIHLHHGIPELDSLESSILAGQPFLGEHDITWATRRLTKLQACNWLDHKVAYINSWGGFAYMKFNLALRQRSVERLLAAVPGHSFPSLSNLLNGAPLPEELGKHHPLRLF